MCGMRNLPLGLKLKGLKMPLDSVYATTTHEGYLFTGTSEKTWYWHVPSLLCSEQIQRVIEICTEETLSPGLVTSEGIITDFRKSLVTMNGYEELYEMVRGPMQEVNSLSGWNFDITAIEEVQYTVYNGANNDQYSWHLDSMENDHLIDKGSDNIQNGTIRKISCSIPLDSSEDYDGGNFEFMVGIPTAESLGLEFRTSHISPPKFREKGSAIFFPSFTFHQVTPVTKGTRRSLVVWFRGPKWR